MMNPMNKVKQLVLILICFFAIKLSASSTPIFSINDRFSDDEVAFQLKGLSNLFEMKYTDQVKELINKSIANQRATSEAIIGRSNYFFPIMESIIEKHNLPLELKYLSVIESGLRPSVKSRAGAVGLWQFISSTAKMYDLKISSTHDDRKDVSKATNAAAAYLTDLYIQFEDWGLALAAYNCGPGNVNKALTKAGKKTDYWDLQKYLPKETQKYLPKLIAAMYMMEYSEQLGLENVSDHFTEYNSFGLAIINNKTSFNTISELSGISISDIKKYNPSFAHTYIPETKNGSTLILPEMYLLTYLQNTSQMDLLQEVFYLKNSLFNIDTELSSVKPTETEIESTHAEIETEILQMNLLDENNFKLNTPLLSNKMTLYAIKEKEVKMIKLKKRQSVADLISSNIITAQSSVLFVSNSGVVHYID